VPATGVLVSQEKKQYVAGISSMGILVSVVFKTITVKRLMTMLVSPIVPRNILVPMGRTSLPITEMLRLQIVNRLYLVTVLVKICLKDRLSGSSAGLVDSVSEV
jgi:hypothetical protein